MQWKNVSPASEINHCKQQRELKLPHVGVKLKEKQKKNIDTLLHEDE